MVLTKEAQGRQAWKLLHIGALSYSKVPDEKEKILMNDYLTNFADGTMLCEECRAHWKEMVAKSPPGDALNSRDKLFKWTVDRHNEVNLRLGKQPYSYGEALKATQECATQTQESISKQSAISIAIGFLAGVLIFGK